MANCYISALGKSERIAKDKILAAYDEDGIPCMLCSAVHDHACNARSLGQHWLFPATLPADVVAETGDMLHDYDYPATLPNMPLLEV